MLIYSVYIALVDDNTGETLGAPKSSNIIHKGVVLNTSLRSNKNNSGLSMRRGISFLTLNTNIGAPSLEIIVDRDK